VLLVYCVTVAGDSDLQSLLSNMNQQQLMQLLGNVLGCYGNLYLLLCNWNFACFFMCWLLILSKTIYVSSVSILTFWINIICYWSFLEILHESYFLFQIIKKRVAILLSARLSVHANPQAQLWRQCTNMRWAIQITASNFCRRFPVCQCCDMICGCVFDEGGMGGMSGLSSLMSARSSSSMSDSSP